MNVSRARAVICTVGTLTALSVAPARAQTLADQVRLYSAIENCNPGLVELELRERCADVDGGGKYSSLLVVALEQRGLCKFDVIPLLIKAGADIELRDGRGRTPLHRLAHGYDPRAVGFLLGFGADPNAADKAGTTPLMVAAGSNKIAIAQLLLAAGADPRRRDRKKDTAAGLARRNGYDRLARLLREAEARPVKRGVQRRRFVKAPLDPACASPRPSRAAPWPSAKGAPAPDHALNVFVAAMEMVRRCDRAGLQALLGTGCLRIDAPRELGRMVHEAVRVQKPECRGVVKDLLDGGPALDEEDSSGWTSLIRAAFVGDLEMVRLLVAAGAPLDVQDEGGTSALLCAADSGNADMVRVLLGAGADPLLVGAGKTAAAAAASKGHAAVAATLKAAERAGPRRTARPRPAPFAWGALAAKCTPARLRELSERLDREREARGAAARDAARRESLAAREAEEARRKAQAAKPAARSPLAEFEEQTRRTTELGKQLQANADRKAADEKARELAEAKERAARAALNKAPCDHARFDQSFSGPVAGSYSVEVVVENPTDVIIDYRVVVEQFCNISRQVYEGSVGRRMTTRSSYQISCEPKQTKVYVGGCRAHENVR
jgi:ankyrin repeat protein